MSLTTPRLTRRQALHRGALLAAGAGLARAPISTGLAAAASPLDRLAAAQLDFGFRLFETLAAGTPRGQNLVISPLSIALALSMTASGARGETWTAMAHALGLGTLSPGELNAASAGLLAHLHALDPAVELRVADSLWLRQGVTALSGFREALGRSYRAEVASLDFADPHAPRVINAWVKEQTHGLISSIVSRIPPEMILYLINALYLKAPWSAPFQPASTRPGPFALAGGESRTLPMMTRTGLYRHYKGAAYEAIRLPYAAGKVAMYVVLPAPGGSALLSGAALDERTWAGLPASLTPEMGTIVLPRFSVAYGARLNAGLAALGMGIAFDPGRADLSGMVRLRGERAFIGDVQHRTVLRVAEQGTLAAAATSVGVGITAMPVARFTMTVDRPFFCALRDETTGLLLFMGAITAPQP